MEKVNIGIIGVGRIERLHTRNLKYQVPGTKVLAVADIFEKSARDAASLLEIPKVTISQINYTNRKKYLQ